MKKLRLDPETLRVDSFEVPAPSGRTGTVHGRIGYIQPMEPYPEPIRLSAGDDGSCNRSWVDSCYFNTCYHNCTGDTWCDDGTA